MLTSSQLCQDGCESPRQRNFRENEDIFGADFGVRKCLSQNSHQNSLLVSFDQIMTHAYF